VGGGGAVSGVRTRKRKARLLLTCVVFQGLCVKREEVGCQANKLGTCGGTFHPMASRLIKRGQSPKIGCRVKNNKNNYFFKKVAESGQA
jgi:hypothetical protein